MKACALAFAAKATGAGVQTVTGVVDHNGDTFVGKIAFFQSNGTLNSIDYASSTTGLASSGYNRVWGYDDDSLVARLSTFTGDHKNTIDAKFVSNGTSGQYSCIGFRAITGPPGTTFRGAYISAFRDGEFDLTYVGNTETGDYINVLILGGDDLEYLTGRLHLAGISTSFLPVGVLLQHQQTFSATTFFGGGGGYCEIGFATSDGAMGTSSIGVDNQGGNKRTQLTDLAIKVLSGTPEELYVTSWDSDSLTFNAGSDIVRYTVFGGIQARCGVFTIESGLGHQIITTGINNRVVLVSTIGSVPTGALLEDYAEWALGTITEAGQTCYWCGESTIGNSVPILGARYLSDEDIMLCGVPNAGSTTFSFRASFVSFDPTNGTFTINKTVNDDIGRQGIWFALGDELEPPPPPSPSSGIYFLDPTATNDTLYLTYDPVTVLSVKIP